MASALASRVQQAQARGVSRIAEARNLFKIFDRNNDGFLSMAETKAALSDFGYDDDDMEASFNKADEGKPWDVAYPQFTTRLQTGTTNYLSVSSCLGYITSGVRLVRTIGSVLTRLLSRIDGPLRSTDEESIRKILMGDFSIKPKNKEKVIRIFLSSTFTDTKHERDALMDRAYPRLRTFCAEFGCGMPLSARTRHLQQMKGLSDTYEFQMVDMRWGVRDESTNDHQTQELCMREIFRCQEVSAGPNFVSLLGQKYGYRPLPATIDKAELDSILGETSVTSDKKLLQNWYILDSNMVPPHYVLQPITDREEFWGNGTSGGAFEALTRILRTGAFVAFEDEETLRKYQVSITEEEIHQGVLKLPDPNTKVYWFWRTIENIKPTDQAAGLYIDMLPASEGSGVDEEKQELLRILREEKMEKVLDQANIHRYQVSWRSEGIEPDRDEDHSEYIKQFTADFTDTMMKAISHDIRKDQAEKPTGGIVEEVVAHIAFCQRKCTGFVGRQETLDRIDEFLKLDRDPAVPLVVYGESGCGKTSVMAMAANRAKQTWAAEHCIILRFIGTTPKSSSGRVLMRSIIGQMAKVYRQTARNVPRGYQELILEFRRYCEFPTNDVKLILGLDSLDQLSHEDNARDLSWLPRHLGSNVKLIVSTIPDEKYGCFQAIKSICGANEGCFVEVTGMTAADSQEIVAKWLKQSKRNLTPSQYTELLEAFRECPLPIFFKLAFDQSKKWRSYTPIASAKLARTVRNVIVDLFTRLELTHGMLLVSYSLSYMTCARHGISSAELEDVVSLSDEVLDDVFQYWVPPVRRLPGQLWFRVLADLSEYIIQRDSHGTPVLAWHHRHFWEACSDRYLKSGMIRVDRHRLLAEYFLGKWAQGKPCSTSKGQPVDRLVLKQSLVLGGIRDDKLQLNVRKLSELPHHLRRAKMFRELEETLTYLPFIEAAFRCGLAYEIVAELSEPPSGTNASKEWTEFSRFCRHNAQTLATFPANTLQQAANFPEGSAPQLAAEQAIRNGDELGYIGAWLRHRNKPVALDAMLQVVPHSSTVHAMCYTSDGGVLATACDDRAILLWDGKTGLQQGRLENGGHTDRVNSVSFNDRGTILASGSRDQTVITWDIHSMEPSLRLLGHTGNVLSVHFSPDDFLLSSSADRSIRIWDLNTRSESLILNSAQRVNSAVWSPDGLHIAAGLQDKSVRVWEAEERTKLGKWVKAKVIQRFDNHAGPVTCVTFAPNGQFLASASSDNTVFVWDTRRWVQRYRLDGHQAGVTSVAFSHNSAILASGSYDKLILLWEIKTGKRRLQLDGHADAVTAVSFSPDGHTLASCSTDMTARLWDAWTDEHHSTPLSHTGNITCLRFSRNGNFLASSSIDKTVAIWNVADAKISSRLSQHTLEVTKVAFSPVADVLATASSDLSVLFWDPSSGKNLHRVGGHNGAIKDIEFSPDGTFFATASLDRSARIFDGATGQFRIALSDHKDAVLKLGWSIDCVRIATCCADGVTKVWLADHGAEVVSLNDHVGPVLCCAWCPTDCHILATGGADGMVWLYDLPVRSSGMSRTASHQLTLHTSAVHDIAFHPDGVVLASCSADTHICLWNMRTGKLLHKLQGHTSPVTALSFNPRFAVLATGGDDEVVRFWHSHTGNLRAMFPVPKGCRVLAWDASGEQFACADMAGRVFLCKLEIAQSSLANVVHLMSQHEEPEEQPNQAPGVTFDTMSEETPTDRQDTAQKSVGHKPHHCELSAGKKTKPSQNGNSLSSGHWVERGGKLADSIGSHPTEGAHPAAAHIAAAAAYNTEAALHRQAAAMNAQDAKSTKGGWRKFILDPAVNPTTPKDHGKYGKTNKMH